MRAARTTLVFCVLGFLCVLVLGDLEETEERVVFPRSPYLAVDELWPVVRITRGSRHLKSIPETSRPRVATRDPRSGPWDGWRQRTDLHDGWRNLAGTTTRWTHATLPSKRSVTLFMRTYPSVVHPSSHISPSPEHERLTRRRREFVDERSARSGLEAAFLHLPRSSIENMPEADTACDSLLNASLLHEPPPSWIARGQSATCPVRLRVTHSQERAWPRLLVAVECACPSVSCNPRGAHTCMQMYSPVMVLRKSSSTSPSQGYGVYAREMVPSGCRCMVAKPAPASQTEPGIV